MQSTEKKVLHLTEDLLVATGSHRKCYQHPDDSRKCIKVAFGDMGVRTVAREIKYLHILMRRGKKAKTMPVFYGPIETDRGRGYIYELVCNADGSPCLTLGDFFHDMDLLQEHFDTIRDLLCFLHADILQGEVVTMTIEVQNILFPQDAQGRLSIKMINDIGSPVLIPVFYYSSFFARRKVERRWKQFRQKMLRSYHEPLIRELVAQI